jgi:hypothetical protein
MKIQVVWPAGLYHQMMTTVQIQIGIQRDTARLARGATFVAYANNTSAKTVEVHGISRTNIIPAPHVKKRPANLSTISHTSSGAVFKSARTMIYATTSNATIARRRIAICAGISVVLIVTMCSVKSVILT